MKDTTIVTGYVPDERGRDALALAALLTNSATKLIVADIYPPPWPAHTKGRVDAEWVAFLRQRAEKALVEAKTDFAGLSAISKVKPTFVADAHKGSGRGLIEIVRRYDADLIVVGAAPGASKSRNSIGSTADQLLHGSPVPVVLAPRGYHEEIQSAELKRPSRITVAYQRGTSDVAVAKAVEYAAGWRASLRLLSVVVGGRAGSGKLTKQQREWSEQDLAAAEEKLETKAVCEVVSAANVGRALGSTEWLPGELLVCGSSTAGPVRKVFLGDMAGKIIRAAQCPVMVVPRGR